MKDWEEGLENEKEMERGAVYSILGKYVLQVF